MTRPGAPTAYRGKVIRPIGRLRLGVDIVVAVAFFAVTGFFALYASGGWPANALVAGFMAAALAMRRLSPAIALAAAWAGSIVQMSLGMEPAIANLAILGVLYATAAYGNRLVMWLGLASTLVGAVTITAYLSISYGMIADIELALQVYVPVMLAALFAFALSWTAGALVRTFRRAQDNREAQRRAEEEVAAEHERGRIARDMHDVVAHSLTVVVAQANGARYAAKADPRIASDALATISQTAGSALADVRMLLAQLRHREAEGPQPTIADLDPLFAQLRQAGLDLTVDLDPAPRGDVPAAVQLAVYRILQEALTNTLRHGDGPAEVRIAWHERSVSLSVRNTVGQEMGGPRGPAPAEGRGGADRRGHGIIGMRERAALVGGSLDVERGDGTFAVTAEIPWEESR